MGKFIITEDDKRHIKSLYEQTTVKPQTENAALNITPLAGGIKFVINNKSGFSAGSEMGGVTSELGQGNFILFNQVPSAPGAALTLDFLNTSGAQSAIVSMLNNKIGFMKDAKMFGIDDRGAMDFISLVCRGFYGNITKENVISLLQSLRLLQQNQAKILGSSIISNFESIFKTIVSISSMTGPDFYAKFPTNLVSNKWGAGGNEMKAIYSASIEYFPGNIKKV
jgi:hypothetical protein